MNLIQCGTSSPSELGLSDGFCNSPFHSSNILRGPKITFRTYLAILDYITVVKCIQDLLCQKTLGDGAVALKRCNRFEIGKGSHVCFSTHFCFSQTLLDNRSLRISNERLLGTSDPIYQQQHKPTENLSISNAILNSHGQNLFQQGT